MFENESFVSFKNRFLEYAAAAEIPAARRLKDIWYKCTPDLRIATSDFPLNHLSFAILSQQLISFDHNRTTALAEKKRR